ncbi:hypothetical protein OIDMADRAFT_30852 [Oidiodendron maius Zn]|uniref:Heterokaryon incompatibility domain-containing protein n=1 Tax=Oidiodendron maius (strain Zn) TaxID=913774 RepID=A0A0C3DBC7_OIDMZ|nr:hypothetical protein OIDMADRAFT_30852 [Oidiodendron maius Zn]
MLYELRMHHKYSVANWEGVRHFQEDELQDANGIRTSDQVRSLRVPGAFYKGRAGSIDIKPVPSIMGRSISDDASLALPLLKGWLNTCLSDHDNCHNTIKNPVALPTRVIDVESFQGSKDVRLTLGNGRQEPYLALSHRWGDPKKIPQTMTKNFQDHLARISFATLPKSFQDAVVVARVLQVRFIWIDSLCIIQDSIADWEQEASRMSGIYKGSLVTIGSACAEDATGGFLHPRPHVYSCTLSPLFDHLSVRPIRDAAKPFNIQDPSSTTLGRSYTCLPDYEPLNSRAWCLQESILPTRMVWFTLPQLYWSCNTLQTAEGEQQTTTHSSSFEAELKLQHIQYSATPMRMWIRTIEDFSTRNLTKISDKLPSISGIAREFHSVFNDTTYVAGLWSHDFHRSLVWQGAQTTKQVKPYRSPTWSWAACDGPLKWDQTSDLLTAVSSDLDLIVTDWHVDLSNTSNPFGQVTGGHLDIDAVCFAATYVVDYRPDSFGWEWSIAGWDKRHLDRSEFDHQRRRVFSGDFILVRVAAWTRDDWDRDNNKFQVPYVAYLIVEPCSEKEYQRVGMAWADGSWVASPKQASFSLKFKASKL